MFKNLKEKASTTGSLLRGGTSKRSSTHGAKDPIDEHKRSLPRAQTEPISSRGDTSSPQKFDGNQSTILKITVHKGENLLPLDKTGTSDPYAIFGLVSSKKRFKTKTISRTVDPCWEETITVRLKKHQGGEKDFVVFELFDKDLLTSDDAMGVVKASMENLKPSVPFTKWHDVMHPSGDPKKQAGRIRVTLLKTVEDESSIITKSLRNKMFATLTVTQMKLREWGVEAEVSIEVVFGIFKMTMAVGAQASEKNLDELQLQMNELRREIANTPTDEEEEQELEMMDTNSKKPTRFEKVLTGSMDKLRSTLSVSRAQFIERGLFGSVGAGVCFKAYAIEFEVMLTLKVSASETVFQPDEKRRVSLFGEDEEEKFKHD